MEADLVHFWLSILDVMDILKDVRKLMNKAPADHHLAQDNFMQVTLKLIAINKDIDKKNQSNKAENPNSEILASFTDSWANAKLVAVRNPTRLELFQSDHTINRARKVFQSSQVLPVLFDKSKMEDIADLVKFFSQAERDVFIQKSTHVFFITEYLVLVEYAEVVLPIIYSKICR
ncbi:hypothetical protein P3T76_001166 [Phytophthora citrophthora]|uniref:Uncharacterized protein n=1 Tax=Phytophthora citrophthora TaxID=4793 RepID=A0AAD9GYX4_9STRA|nr:hypothetical protein P3T76_001166 [Phytophthora citrophthora]